MRRHFGILSVVLILVSMILSSCGGGVRREIRRSISPGFGGVFEDDENEVEPSVEEEESKKCSSIISHYFTISCCYVNGEPEIWVESNFLSESHLKSLADKIANFYSADLIIPLYYPNTKSCKSFDERYMRYIYSVYSNYIELKTETNTLFGGIKATRTERFYDESPEKLIPKTVKRGYRIFFREMEYANQGVFSLKNHRNYPVVLILTKPHFYDRIRVINPAPLSQDIKYCGKG